MELKILDLGYVPPEKKSVLVVDDESAVQSLINDSLVDYHKLYSAFTAKEGLEKAELVKPNLILMDIMLPDMNGYDAIKLLGSKDQTKFIPVIVITARDFEPSTIRLIKSETNVVGFITKPFRVQNLRSKIQLALDGKKFDDGF